MSVSESKISHDVRVNRKATYEIDAQFLNRWSPRAYGEQRVDDERLNQILEAARWAPSGNNLQPWRFIVARTPEDRTKFLSFISPYNAEWCHRAPVLVVLVSERTRPDGSMNVSHAFDAGAAWGYLALQASNLGLYAHAMGGFDRQKAREVLNIPTEFEPQVVISIGYYGDPKELSEKQQAREIPSARRPLADSVFDGEFATSGRADKA